MSPVTTSTTGDFLRALHPVGFRDLRALRSGEAPLTFGVPVDDLGEIETFAKTCPDRNLYFGVATRSHADGRGLDDCLALHALFVDLDFKETSEAETRDRLAAFQFAPSAVVSTGGGLHVYWFLDEPLDLQNGGAPFAKRVLRRLATALEADIASAEPARILRLPGSLNHKFDPPRPVVLEEFNDRRYALDDFLAVLPQIDDEPSGSKRLPTAITEGSRNTALFQEWQRVGLRLPTVVQEATKTYWDESQPIARFLADCCELDATAKTEFNKLWSKYLEWHSNTSREPRLPRPEFTAALQAQFSIELNRHTKGKLIVGVKPR